MTFLFLDENIHYGYSLEVPLIIFCGDLKKKIVFFFAFFFKKNAFLELWRKNMKNIEVMEYKTEKTVKGLYKCI